MLQHKSLIANAFVLLCLYCPALYAQKTDQLIPVKGTTISGIVISMSPTEVTINVRGTDQKISVLDIKRLSFSEEPRELSIARDNILSGDWESASEQLKKIDLRPSLVSLPSKTTIFTLPIAWHRELYMRGATMRPPAKH